MLWLRPCANIRLRTEFLPTLRAEGVDDRKQFTTIRRLHAATATQSEKADTLISEIRQVGIKHRIVVALVAFAMVESATL
jgi:hypothetical protein